MGFIVSRVLLFTTVIAAFSVRAEDVRVPEIQVFGVTPAQNPLDLMPTVSELSGQRLDRARASTLGETLGRQPGVTSSQFGPNASRPVIRGQDGDRVRVLQNGTGVLDASAASPDHAVAIDPLTLDRLEILRGPAALLYGPSAVGGAVNLVTARIPERALSAFTGKAELRGATVDKGRSGGTSLELPLGDHVVTHVDASLRAADDMSVPGYARTVAARAEEPAADEQSGRLYNSFNRTGSGALGASYIFERGFVGTSFADYESSYGTVAERNVHINLLQQRWDLAGEIRDLGWITSVRARNTYSHYRHNEMEGSDLGTSFRNDGDEARVEARHRPVLDFAGVFGAQMNAFDFSARGEEAFLPGTKTRTYSAFVYEEQQSGRWRPSFGARLDATRVQSVDDPRLGAGQTGNYTGGSYSLGVLYQLNTTNALVLTGSFTERAPSYEELFANGPHAATHQYEVGDPGLKKEQSRALELSYRYKGEQVRGSANVFVQDYNNFISLQPTGVPDPGGSPLKVWAYRQIGARFVGAELEARYQLPDPVWGGQLEFEVRADTIRGWNRNTGDNLPRLAPVREALGVVFKTDRVNVHADVQRSERQTRTAPGETETAAYTLLNVGAEAPLGRISAFARVDNIFDTEARNAASVLKELSPLPGRNFVLGLQARF